MPSEVKFADACVASTCKQCGVIVESLEPSRCFYCTAMMCWPCWDEMMGSCRGCTEEAKRWSEKMKQARALGVAAGLHKIGRPKARKRCPICSKMFGAREIRIHKPICSAVLRDIPDTAIPETGA